MISSLVSLLTEMAYMTEMILDGLLAPLMFRMVSNVVLVFSKRWC